MQVVVVVYIVLFCCCFQKKTKIQLNLTFCEKLKYILTKRIVHETGRFRISLTIDRPGHALIQWWFLLSGKIASIFCFINVFVAIWTFTTACIVTFMMQVYFSYRFNTTSWTVFYSICSLVVTICVIKIIINVIEICIYVFTVKKLLYIVSCPYSLL